MKKRRNRNTDSNRWLTGAFLVSLVAVGAPYWSTPYYRLSLPDTLLEYAVMPLAVVGIVLSFLCTATTARIALAIGAAVPAAVFIRIAADIAQNPSSHNLWPIEIVVAIIVGMIVAWPAAAIGGVLRYASGRHKAHLR